MEPSWPVPSIQAGDSVTAWKMFSWHTFDAHIGECPMWPPRNNVSGVEDGWLWHVKWPKITTNAPAETQDTPRIKIIHRVMRHVGSKGSGVSWFIASVASRIPEIQPCQALELGGSVCLRTWSSLQQCSCDTNKSPRVARELEPGAALNVSQCLLFKTH